MSAEQDMSALAPEAAMFLATLAAWDVSALAENTQSTNTVSTELDGLATAEITGVTQVNFGPSFLETLTLRVKHQD